MKNTSRLPNIKPEVTTFMLLSKSGKPIRLATKVVFANGEEVKFIERLPIKEAMIQAESILERRREAERARAEQVVIIDRNILSI